MNVVLGDMWQEIGNATILLCTTNAVINSKGELVMGRGAALEMKQKYPGIEKALAKRIMDKGCHYRPWFDDNKPYGVISAGMSEGDTMLGAFQVKWSWDQDADLRLIDFSCKVLCQIAPKYSRIVLNYPGVGNGRLTVQQVEPILRQLPDNVYIYTKA